jgi:hypothetical protein
LVQPLREKFQYPNNKFQINFNDQIPKGTEGMQRGFVCPLKEMTGCFEFWLLEIGAYLGFGA